MPSDCAPTVAQAMSEANVQNIKALLDRYVALLGQGAEDNQSNARAYAAINLRRAENAATVDHLANIGLLQLGQTGATENQQTVSPVRTGTGDAIAAVPGVAAGQVAANIADLATSLVPVFSAIETALAALQSTLVAAAGNAAGTTKTTSS